MGKLDGRVAVITGARAVSVAPPRNGSSTRAPSVLLVDLEERALRSAVDAIGGNHARLRYAPM